MTDEPNPNEKYEEITKFILRDVPERVGQLEETVTNTLAGYRQREVPEGEKVGKGFGTKLYDDLKDAYATQRGIDPSKIKGELTDIFDAKVMSALGFTRQGLEDKFSGKEKLTDGDIDELKKAVNKSAKKAYDEDVDVKMKSLGDEDLEPFKNYVGGALEGLGGTVDKDRFVTLKDTIEAYNLFLNTTDKVGEANMIGEMITKVYGPAEAGE